MFQTNHQRRSPYAQNTAAVQLESLESRQLLSAEPWAASSKLIALDRAVAHYPTITGAGEAIAVIDSGVDYNHPALGGGFGANYKVEAGWDFQSNDANPMSDTYAHGTGVAGVLGANHYVYNGVQNQGVAPGARIIALRENSTNGVKAALDWVYANRTKYNIVAVNMTDFGGASGLIYKDVLKNLIAAGVFVSHAAGNGGASVPVSTALDPADFAVGAVGLNGQLTSFTQRGAELDLVAPGQNVTLPYYDISTKKHIYVDNAEGTSFASPAATGTAALIKQIDPRFTPMQIMQIMQDSGTATYDATSNRTYKRLNVDAALALAYARRSGTPQPPLSSGTVSVPARSPFSGTAIKIGADTTVQAEDFDNGGEGVTWHDTDAANLGGSKYRTTGVDIQDAGSLRYVGYAKAGEWMEYSVNVTTAGVYDLSATVASLQAGGKFHVLIDGVDKTGLLTVPNTGGWQTWGTVTKTGIALTAGNHVVRVVMDANGSLGYVANFDAFRFKAKATTSSTPTTPTTPTRSAFLAIQATTANAVSGLTTTGGYLGSLDNGDWARFDSVDFGTTGATRVALGVAAASGWGGKQIQIRTGSPTGTIVGILTVTATGGWTTVVSQSTTVAKLTGVQTIYLTASGGSGVGNLFWLRFA